MTKKYFVLFFIFTSCFINGQKSIPPSNGLAPVYYAIDDNNDGFAKFNTHYLVETIFRNWMKPEYDLSGYELQSYPSYEDRINGTNVIGNTFTNTVINKQECFLKFIYTGNGTEYNEGLLEYLYGGYILEPIPFDGDFDKDGVLNAAETVPLIMDTNTTLNDIYFNTDGDGLYNFEDKDDDGDGILTINEDTNKNGNYEDDDSNGNTIPDYLDSKNTLTVNQESKDLFTITPNPASNFINLNLDNTLSSTYKVSIYDTSGKLVLQVPNSKQIAIESLKSGIYILKVKTDTHSMTKKLIVL